MRYLNIRLIEKESEKFADIDKNPSNRQLKSENEEFNYAILDNGFQDFSDVSFLKIRNDLMSKKVNFDNLLGETSSNKIDKIAIGAFVEDEMVAVAVFSPVDDNDALLDKLCELKIGKAVRLEFLYVEKDHRGFLLSQKLMAIGEIFYRKEGYETGIITMKNIDYHMLNSAFKQSYTVVALHEDSYILTCPLGNRLEDVVEQYSVRNKEMKWQQDVLDLGFVGMKCINYRAEDDFFVSYSKAYYY